MIDKEPVVRYTDESPHQTQCHDQNTIVLAVILNQLLLERIESTLTQHRKFHPKPKRLCKLVQAQSNCQPVPPHPIKELDD
jgi:hypothetical protein